MEHLGSICSLSKLLRVYALCKLLKGPCNFGASKILNGTESHGLVSKLLLELLDTQVWGAVDRGSCWRFLGLAPTLLQVPYWDVHGTFSNSIIVPYK